MCCVSAGAQRAVRNCTDRSVHRVGHTQHRRRYSATVASETLQGQLHPTQDRLTYLHRHAWAGCGQHTRKIIMGTHATAMLMLYFTLSASAVRCRTCWMDSSRARVGGKAGNDAKEDATAADWALPVAANAAITNATARRMLRRTGGAQGGRERNGRERAARQRLETGGVRTKLCRQQISEHGPVRST